MNFSHYSNSTKDLLRGHFPEKIYSRVLLTILRVVCIAALIGIFSLAGLALGTLMGIINEAPDFSVDSIVIDEQTSYIYDQDGNLIITLETEINRSYVESDEISQNVINAVIAIEDERYYSHHGIDYQAIGRAIVSQLTGGSEGGSTITQQLIKNMVLTSEQTITRKVQEWYLALVLEYELTEQYGSSYAKELILETYLNYVNFGHSTYGVESASQRYFGKSASDLTVSEAAVLAAVINAPTRYDPINNPEVSQERQQLVLERMYEQGYLTEAEYEEALADDVYERIAAYNEEYLDEDEETEVYSYFVDAAIEQAIDDLVELGYTETEASNLLYYGGVKMYITQDAEVQAVLDEVYNDDSNFQSETWYQATYYLTIYDEKDPEDETLAQNLYFIGLYSSEEAIDKAVEEFKEDYLDEDAVEYVDYVESLTVYVEPQSTAVIMDQSTGWVVAIVGGRGEKTTSRSLNRATESERQPGSCFKIIASFSGSLDMYVATPATVYDDVPFEYEGWTVHNWWGDYYKGLCTIREATANSQNIIAVKNMIATGVEEEFEYVLSYGFTTLRSELDEDGNTDVVPSLALGSGSVTNLELTAAYAAIANGGVYQEPMFYTRIEDSEGNIIIDKTETQETHQVIQETTAYLLTSMMEDVVSGDNGGTGTAANFNADMGIAGKTGTTTDENDLWFVGYTPYYTMGIWFGYDYNEYSNVDSSVFSLSTSYHIKLFATVMSELHEDLEDAEFEIPDGITTAEVCSESGMLATSLCESAGCAYTEYFDENNVPTEECEVHVKATVCTTSGKLATDYCPSTKTGIYIQRTDEQLEEIDSDDYSLIADWDDEVPTSYCTTHSSSWYASQLEEEEEEEEETEEEEDSTEEEEETQEETETSDSSEDSEDSADTADTGGDTSDTTEEETE